MKADAENQKTALNMEELKSKNAHNLVIQGLDDSTAAQTADKNRKTNELQQAREVKGQTDGGLADENQALKENENMLATTTQDCADQKADYESQAKGRAEEVEAINAALNVLENPDFAAASGSRVAASFLQIGNVQQSKAVALLEGMARDFHSTSLAELAIKARTATGANAGNVFAKVMGMIEGMIAKLKKQLASETKRHQFCKKSIAEGKAKQEKTQAELDNVNARLEQSEADLATLKDEMATLSKEIADLDASVAEATKIRNTEAANFAKAQDEFQQGIAGLEQAIQILTEYFGAKNEAGHEQHTGTAETIISMLQTANQDFTNGLAEAQQTEKKAQADYENFMQESKVLKAQKQASLKGKGEESVRLASAIEDLKSDQQNTEEELAAVNKALEKLNDMCTTKAVSFEDRMAAMTKEIEGLKQALKILNGEQDAASEE